MTRIIKTLHNTFGFEEFFIPQQSITFLRKSQYLNYSGQQINKKKAVFRGVLPFHQLNKRHTDANLKDKVELAQ